MKMHRHKAIARTTSCFSACAAPSRCNQAAHGGLRVIERCACGATRTSNRNGRHAEDGRWQIPA